LSAALAGETRDAAALHAAVERLRAAAHAAVARFGGVVIAEVGDAITAVTGVPRARSRDTELAVRIALQLQAEAGVPLRIGLACGPAMVEWRDGNTPVVLAGAA